MKKKLFAILLTVVILIPMWCTETINASELPSLSLYFVDNEAHCIATVRGSGNIDVNMALWHGNSEVFSWNASNTIMVSSYALTPNSKFDNLNNVDCQNYASQCVWYALGGSNTTTAINSHAEPMASAGNSNRNWYFDAYGNSDSVGHWKLVQKFYNLISGSNASYYGLYGTVTSGFDNANVGDVIQIEYTGDSTYDHSLVVVGITGTPGSLTASQIRVSGHSSCVSNVPLTDYYSTSASYRTIHIVQCRGMDSPLYLDSFGHDKIEVSK